MKLRDVVRKEENEYVLFKITPHMSNLNSTSRKFQTSIFELFSYKYPKYPWHRVRGIGAFNKDNLYLTLRNNPKFWWIIKMYGMEEVKSTSIITQSESTQRIEFYIGVPLEFRESFKIKFHNHEQWKKATLEETIKDIKFSEVDDTDLYNVKYIRNDMFSLSYDYTRQNSPIRDIMAVSKELKADESITLFIQTEAMSRRKWKSLVEYSWDLWNRGKVPSRPGLDPSMLVTDTANLALVCLHEAKGVIDDVLYGVSKSFFNEKEPKPNRKTFKGLNSEREELMVNGDLSKPTKSKRNKPVFKTNILYTVTSRDSVKRDMLGRSMYNAFSDLNGDNILRPMKIVINYKNIIKALNDLDLELSNPNLMSVDEIGKLEQLPTAELQREFEDVMVANKRIETDVDKELLDSKGILVGTSTNRGNKYNIHIQTNNFDLTSTSRVFIGSPRMGKDQAVINLVVESKLKHNMGAVVLDVINEKNGHRGMADAIRDHLPAEEIIDLNILDTDNPIYLGLESIVKSIKDSRIASDRIAEELCNFLLSDGDEDKFRTVEFLREAAKLTNGDLLSIKHVFTSETFRKDLVSKKRKIFDVDIWEQYDNLSDKQQQAIYLPVMRRLGQITSSEFLKPIFCQLPNTKLDLFKLLDEGKVVIFRMKVGVMSQRVTQVLSYWIVLITFLIKLTQGGDSKAKGTYLVLNEPREYLTDNLVYFIERILTEGPKYRLIPLIIFHNFKQFKDHSGFIDILKSSSLNWHIFKNTNEDVYKELYQGYLSKTFDSPTQAFESTKMYQYIGLFLNSQGSYYNPFVADALPLIGDRYTTRNNAQLTLEHSKKYGRPIDEVLEEIKLRNREANKPPTSNKSK